MMVDFSEYGIICLLTNFVLITLLFMTIYDGYYFFKKREKFISFLAFGILLIVGITVSVLTSLLSVNNLALILSALYAISLIIGIRYKRIVTTVWVAFILIFIGFFIGFIQYLILGENGSTIAFLKINKVEKNEISFTVQYNNRTLTYKSSGEMVGIEAFQITFKPFMHSLFGGKRFLINSVFTEKFNEENTKGETFYHPLGNSLLKKKSLWDRLRRKKILLFGVEGIQRVMVSTYSAANQTYKLKVTNQGLILVPENKN